MAAVYVLCGDNVFFKQKTIDELKRKILEPQTAALNYITHQALADDFISLRENLKSLSLIGQKLILISKADKFSKQQLEEIFSLARSNRFTTLILDSDKEDFSKQVQSHSKNFGAEFHVKIFKKLYTERIPSWLRQRVREKGSYLSAQAAEILTQNLGNNLQLLDSTLDTLINFVGSRGKIEKEDVEQLVGANLSENVFSLIESVADRDIKKVLKLVNLMLRADHEPHQILGVLGWHFTRVLISKKIIEEYKSIEARKKIQELFSLKSFFLQKFMRQVDGFSFVQLKNALKELLRADAHIKTFSANPQYVLEVALVNLCRF